MRCAIPLHPSLDADSPAYLEDLYRFYVDVRQGGPVVRTPTGVGLIGRYTDVARAFRDPIFIKEAVNGSAVTRVAGGGSAPASALSAEFSRWMLFRDPPAHTRLRGLVTKAFTPHVAEAMAPRIHAIVDQLLDAVEGRGGMEAIADYAYPLPFMVIGELIGLSMEGASKSREWTAAIARALDPTGRPEDVVTASEALVSLQRYIKPQIDERRNHPRDDLLSRLISAEEQGGTLSEPELISNVTLLFGAGHETTLNLIGNGLLALLRNPDQLERLRAEPELAQNAVEELLRFDAPVQFVQRWVREDTEFSGVEMRAGERVLLLIGAANRDPEVFPDPDRLDLGRSNVRHLSFSAGPHYCVGAALARLESRIALTSAIERYPTLRAGPGKVSWNTNALFHGVRSLPVTWEGGADHGTALA